MVVPELRPGAGRRICIITNATICCNPRVVKEADALSAAGYEVRVVASQHVSWAVDWDRQLMAQRSWKLDSIRWHDRENGNLRLRSGLRQRAFRALTNLTTERLIPERAYSRLFDELLHEATKCHSDLFIAHNPQALPVAALAAEYFGVDFAFDSEDFHTGEFSLPEQQSASYRLLSHLEARYLPNCAYVTSPSDEISDVLKSRYQLKRVQTIHNVFGWSERKTLDGVIKDRRGPELSLYWYSQIVGLDRGLQDAIRAVALLNSSAQLHIRGDLAENVREELTKLARANGVDDCVHFHPPVPPEELLSRACEHDVGLALELPVTDNRNLTVANKVFHYLLAGLSIAATATAGQQRVMDQFPKAGFVYEPGSHECLAASLQELMDDPSLLATRKTAALKAARDFWNWETEQAKLLELVSSAISR